MPTYILRPTGNLWVYNLDTHTTDETSDPASILTDGSDATFVGFDDPPTMLLLDHLGPISGLISAVTVHARTSSTDVTAENYLPIWLIYLAGTDQDDFIQSAPLESIPFGAPTDGTITDFVLPRTELETDVDYANLVADNLAADCFLHLTDPVVGSFIGYEVWVEITTTGGLTPPCQLYPRDDDQGVGNAAIWPPPSSGRPGSYY
jgi:hypothetical protein